MVSLKIHLLATIMFVSKAYSEGATGTCPQRYGSATPCIIGQFSVPAMIYPCLPSCQAAGSCASRKQTPAACSAACADEDDDIELNKLIYSLFSDIIERKKCSGKNQSNPCSIVEGSTCPSDGYDVYPCCYADDYDYCSCPPAVVYSSGGNSGGSDGSCPEICICVRQVPQASADC